jgi:hypothetical protein
LGQAHVPRDSGNPAQVQARVTAGEDDRERIVDARVAVQDDLTRGARRWLCSIHPGRLSRSDQ